MRVIISSQVENELNREHFVVLQQELPIAAGFFYGLAYFLEIPSLVRQALHVAEVCESAAGVHFSPVVSNAQEVEANKKILVQSQIALVKAAYMLRVIFMTVPFGTIEVPAMLQRFWVRFEAALGSPVNVTESDLRNGSVEDLKIWDVNSQASGS